MIEADRNETKEIGRGMAPFHCVAAAIAERPVAHAKNAACIIYCSMPHRSAATSSSLLALASETSLLNLGRRRQWQLKLNVKCGNRSGAN